MAGSELAPEGLQVSLLDSALPPDRRLGRSPPDVEGIPEKAQQQGKREQPGKIEQRQEQSGLKIPCVVGQFGPVPPSPRRHGLHAHRYTANG